MTLSSQTQKDKSRPLPNNSASNYSHNNSSTLTNLSIQEDNKSSYLNVTTTTQNQESETLKMTELNQQQNSPSLSSSSPSSCSPPEERHQRSSCSSSSNSSNDEAVKVSSDNQKKKSLTTPCHSLLLTSSSTSSLCSSSKHDSRRNSSYLSSESLNIAHEVELLLTDMCDRVSASSDRLRNGYERLAKCGGHQSEDSLMRQHLRMIRGVLRRRLGLRGLSDCGDGTRNNEDMIESKKKKKRRDSDEDSLSVMLDDVLQYFDFLNAEGDESVDSSVSLPCEEFEANGLSCNEDVESSRDELSEDLVNRNNSGKNSYDLNRLMDLHLTRLWIIEDVRFYFEFNLIINLIIHLISI